ncbi:uncharacterized protein BDW43DRAFT_316316 [Aspergillus alliaceus]|uniref:uncharacterized protein n=1 Tax=Petromyces alliaceus TaxID=209559 RepID=UPI0012A75ED7|nr:uncharacterized protein BDW43DRAFT_316316 [Aspergillus alliaceus]KAB8228010.1 hypothetical protein BDW43DRAFT_316316 [Aspergillus alliaceus]
MSSVKQLNSIILSHRHPYHPPGGRGPLHDHRTNLDRPQHILCLCYPGVGIPSSWTAHISFTLIRACSSISSDTSATACAGSSTTTPTGHNYGEYLALLQEARYFGIDGLQKWLEDKWYLLTVKIKRSVRLEDEIDLYISTIQPANIVEEIHPPWGTRMVYICPRGIGAHRGSPRVCGRKRLNVQDGEDDLYTDEPWLTGLAVVRRTTVFDMEQCFAGSVSGV